jgi:hypothetical protein
VITLNVAFSLKSNEGNRGIGDKEIKNKKISQLEN